MALAVDLDVPRLFSFGSLIDVDARSARLLVWSMWADAGFYLGLVPVAFALAPTSERGGIAAAAGSAYALMGAGGATALAIYWPRLFERFAGGDAGAALAFATLSEFIMQRVWNFACAASGAVWWLLLAYDERPPRTAFARTSWALGALSSVEVLAGAFGLRSVADLALAPLLALLPLWCMLAARRV